VSVDTSLSSNYDVSPRFRWYELVASDKCHGCCERSIVLYGRYFGAFEERFFGFCHPQHHLDYDSSRNILCYCSRQDNLHVSARRLDQEVNLSLRSRSVWSQVLQGKHRTENYIEDAVAKWDTDGNRDRWISTICRKATTRSDGVWSWYDINLQQARWLGITVSQEPVPRYIPRRWTQPSRPLQHCCHLLTAKTMLCHQTTTMFRCEPWAHVQRLRCLRTT